MFLPFISARYPMPTMSMSLVQPVVTPVTALKTSARARPWKAACLSFWRSATRVPSFWTSVMPPGSMALTLPLGPSTRTVLPLTVYLTPVGSGIGFLPIRDMMNPFMACESRVAFAVVPLQPVSRRLKCSYYRIEDSNLKRLCLFSLPDFAENLAADTFAAGLTAGHDTLGSSHDGDAKTSLDAADL